MTTIDLMITDILQDTRFSTQVSFVLWSTLHHDFRYDEDARLVYKRSEINHKRKKLGQAKKEIEALGGYLTFAIRGKFHVEILYNIPK